MTTPAISCRVPRDDRVDFLRGVALLVICIDHIHNNPVARVMPAAFGLSDMSEVFLFLSGMVSVWSVQRALRDGGMRRAIRRCWQRAFVLYLIYVLAGTLLVMLMRSTSTMFLLNAHREMALFAPPGELLLRVAMLQQHVGHLCILLLYAISLVVLPFLVHLCNRRWTCMCLGLLGLGCYVTGQWPAHRLLFPAEVQQTLYYQPLTWVPLFLLGGWCGQVPLSRWSSPWLRFIAMLVLVALTLGHSVGNVLPTIGLLKPTLGPFRLLHFLSLALLVANLLPQHSSWYIPPIRRCGQNSLVTYIAGAIASVLLSAFFVRTQMTLLIIVMGNVLAVGICLLAAETGQLLRAWSGRRP